MKYLKQIRAGKGVSQQSVADYLEISRQAYSNYENGNREPDTETLLKLAEYFGLTVDEILRGPDSAPRPSSADEFTYAAHKYSGRLRPEDKKMIERMMATLAAANEGDDADGPTD